MQFYTHHTSLQILFYKKKAAAAITPQKAEVKQNKNILNQTKHPIKLHTCQSSIYKKYKLHINTQTDLSLTEKEV